jgi:GPI mannosyltransferase 3
LIQRLCILAIIGLALRVFVALLSTNCDHPDELFQYLEPAHRVTFGYGLTTWEYRFGMRSWLIPFLVATPLYLCKIVHCDQPAIYIPAVKILLCILSTSLIFSAYVIGKNLISERVGWLSAVFVTFWYELVYYSFRPLPDVISSYFLLGALACLTAKNSKLSPSLFAICTGFALALRLQYAPIVVYLCVLSLLFFNRKQNMQVAAGIISVLLFCGFVDWYTWGAWFGSYYNMCVAQALLPLDKIFGTRDSLFYVIALLSASLGVLPLAFLLSFKYFRRLWPLIGCAIIVVAVHSFVPTKYYRYIFASIPILSIVASSIFILLLEKIAKTEKATKSGFLTGAIAIALVSLAGIFNWLPNENFAYKHSPLFESEPAKEAFLYLSKQQDLSGLCVYDTTCPWWESGGYYYLHRDVPIYFSSFLPVEKVLPKEFCLSHIMCAPEDPVVSGFAPIALIGRIEIRKRLISCSCSSSEMSSLRSKSQNIFQPGIDDRFKPLVRSFLH